MPKDARNPCTAQAVHLLLQLCLLVFLLKDSYWHKILSFVADLTDLSMHYNSVRLVDLVNGKNMQVCAYCKQKCSHICGLCGKALHLTKPRNLPNATIPCFIAYHDECCFGLAYSDTSIASKRKKKEWTYPTAEDLEGNRKEIRQLKERTNVDL
jgi:hypothetical protein